MPSAGPPPIARRHDAAGRSTSALEDIRDAVTVIGQGNAEDPMFGAHLALALSGLARRLDHLYAELGL